MRSGLGGKTSPASPSSLPCTEQAEGDSPVGCLALCWTQQIAG